MWINLGNLKLLNKRLKSLEEKIVKVDQRTCDHNHTIIAYQKTNCGFIGRFICNDCEHILKTYYDYNKFRLAEAEHKLEEAIKKLTEAKLEVSTWKTGIKQQSKTSGRRAKV